MEVDTRVGKLLLPRSDTTVRPTLERFGDWELDEAMLFCAHLRRGMTVVDIGAHVGYWTVLAGRAVAKLGHVFAIEPDPVNAAFLRANVARNGVRATVVEAAAWNARGRLPLSRAADHNTGDSRVGDGRPSAGVQVDAVLADDLLDGRTVGAVKVDAQGTDHIALAGMEQTLRRSSPVVFAEFWPEGMRERGDDPASAIEFYRSLPYRLTIPGAQMNCDDVPASQLTELADSFPGGFVTVVLRPWKPIATKRQTQRV